MKKLHRSNKKVILFLLGIGTFLAPLIIVSCVEPTKNTTSSAKPANDDKDKIKSDSNTNKPKKDDKDPEKPKNPPVIDVPKQPIKPNPAIPEKPKNPPDIDVLKQPIKPDPTVPKNPPGVPGFDPNNPNFSGRIPNFPSRFVPLTASNIKPTENNYFKETTFKKPKEEDLYKEIYDRSFALRLTSKDLWDQANLVPVPAEKDSYTSLNGTGWLFDYAANSDKSKVSLFLATNLHVAANASNTFGHGAEIGKNKTELFDYTDPTGDYLIGLSLGKPKQDPKTFGPIDNLTVYNRNVGGEAGKLRYFTNLDLSSKGIFLGDKVDSIVGTPKLVFAAFDFMKEDSNKQFDNLIRKHTEEYLAKEEEKTTQYYWIKDYFENKKKIPPLYKDFAIIQIDIDFSKDKTEADFAFKNYVMKAMNAFDQTIKRVKENIVPNNDGVIPYLTYDYESIQKNPNIEQNKELKQYQYSQQYVDDVLVGGFPADSTSEQWWGRNNPTERYKDFKNKQIDQRSFATTLNGGIGVFRYYLNRPFVENYGTKFVIPYSSLAGGASGSLGYNDYGIPIGIHSDGSLNVKNEFDNSKNGFLNPFVQSSDIPIRILDSDKMGMIYAYNLIDGSNKTLYPHQRTSYRENLDLIYKDGIGEFKFKNTAMFPNGYNIKKTN